MPSLNRNKIFVGFLILFAFSNFLYLTREEKGEIFEPWWVWELSVEGLINKPPPVSWKIADNNKVMKSFFGENELKPNYGEINAKTTDENKLKQNFTTVLPKIPIQTIQKTQGTKLILIFNPPKMNMNYNKYFEHCPFKCHMTLDSTRINKADAIVFYNENLPPKMNLTRSHSNQLFVWKNNESPSVTKRKSHLSLFDDVFNMTMTYRKDSNIYDPNYTFAEVEKLTNNHPVISDVNQLIRIKSKFVFYSPQECDENHEAQRPLNIVYMLRLAGLQLDFIGKCYDKTFNHNSNLELSRYKFYLSFSHNWHCKDYISKDLFENAYLIGVVPVIWGPKREDIVQLLPKDSYIFAEDFASPFELVNYLEYLDRNIREYENLLSWKVKPNNAIPQPTYDDFELRGFCQLCSKLHILNNSERLTISSLHKWWYNKESMFCTDPHQFSLPGYFVSYRKMCTVSSFIFIVAYFFIFYIDVVVTKCYIVLAKLRKTSES